MDLQAAQNLRGKHGTLSKVAVAICFTITVALLASSLFSPSRTQTSLRGTYAAADAHR